MEKIPVRETIAHAYGFALRDYLKLLGIAWAPLVVAIAVGLMMTPGFMGAHVDMSDREEMARRTLQMLPLGLLILLPIRAMIMTGVTELALGLRSGMTFVYFSLGGAIWRFIATWLLVVVAMVVLFVGVGIVLGIVVAVGGIALGNALHGTAAEVTGVIGAVLFVLVFYAAIIYIAVRLTFFIPPVVVAEKKVDLARGWQLGQGNVWRIFLIGLAIFIPVFAVTLALQFAIHGPAMFAIFGILSAGFHGAGEEAMRQQTQAWSQTMSMQALAAWPYTAVFSLFFSTFVYGLMTGASVFAYRALVPGTPALRD